MARAIGIFTKYVALPGLFAYALMQVAKPSAAEIEEIRNFTAKNEQFSTVLRAAASPSSKAIYQQKPGEQHPVPELTDMVNKKER